METTINDFSHIMVDIETMGSKSYSSILSIGAIKFNINTGECAEFMYRTISLESCLSNGLTISADTIEWWLNNSDESKKALFIDTSPLQEVLDEFSKFVTKDDQIWGNSARFDLGILQNAYDKLGISIPWDFRKERCLRTLVSFNPQLKENFKYSNIKHNALSDCYNQIGYATEIWNSLKPLDVEFVKPNMTYELPTTCSCSCHRQNGIVHIFPCCNNKYT